MKWCLKIILPNYGLPIKVCRCMIDALDNLALTHGDVISEDLNHIYQVRARLALKHPKAKIWVEEVE